MWIGGILYSYNDWQYFWLYPSSIKAAVNNNNLPKQGGGGVGVGWRGVLGYFVKTQSQTISVQDAKQRTLQDGCSSNTSHIWQLQ